MPANLPSFEVVKLDILERENMQKVKLKGVSEKTSRFDFVYPVFLVQFLLSSQEKYLYSQKIEVVPVVCI